MKFLGAYADMANDHWKEHRPKMYQALKKSHELIPALKAAQKRTSDEMCDLIQKGFQEHEAWEIVKENYVLLPSEYDMPHLGESEGTK